MFKHQIVLNYESWKWSKVDHRAVRLSGLLGSAPEVLSLAGILDASVVALFIALQSLGLELGMQTHEGIIAHNRWALDFNSYVWCRSVKLVSVFQQTTLVPPSHMEKRQ